MAVFEQVQGLLEVLADLGGVGLVAIELALDGVEFSADAVLLLLEQLQGDGSGVVGLEQAAALVLQLGASDSQGSDVLLGAGLDVVQLLIQVDLDQLAVLGAEDKGTVELGYALFDLVDQDGAKVAGVQAVAPGAYQIGVDEAGATFGVLDHQA